MALGTHYTIRIFRPSRCSVNATRDKDRRVTIVKRSEGTTTLVTVVVQRRSLFAESPCIIEKDSKAMDADGHRCKGVSKVASWLCQCRTLIRQTIRTSFAPTMQLLAQGLLNRAQCRVHLIVAFLRDSSALCSRYRPNYPLL